MNRIKPITGYVNSKMLRSLATPSNITLGEEIAKGGGVELIEFDRSHVIARVKPPGGVRRRVALRSTEEGLRWQCTCTRTKLFCKHCVAALLAAKAKSGNGR